MLRTHKMLSLGFAGLLVSGLALAANADNTPTQTQSVSLTPTNVSTNLTFTPFDTSLGTLTSVTIDLSGTAVASATVNGLSSAGTYEFDSSATTQLKAPGAGSTLITILPFNAETQALDPSTLPYSYPTNTGSADSGATTFSAAPTLSLFTGTSPILLPLTIRGTSGVSGPGSITSTVSTQGSASATLYYTYTPAVSGTPEPGTWAMLVAGASTGLVALRRRRNKK